MNHITKRNTVKEIDEILEQQFNLLDHGFIRVIDYMGSDSSIVQAARVSYGQGTKKINEDTGLIRYLMRHYHTTPFEMCEIKLHIKAPFFVARQWLRHRTANVNEYSARYSIIEDQFYVPQPEEVALQSASNKQCREQSSLNDQELLNKTIEIINQSSKKQYQHYQEMLDDNIARELARMSLTLNYYTEFYWKIDLHNLMRFIALRAHPHAQYEIRVYALKIMEILKLWVPTAYQAFLDYQFNCFNLSAQMKNTLQRMINGEKIDQQNSGLTKREWQELQDHFNFEN